ncbi:OprD family outer membrane porin [Halopseudomonas formosensis]|uniref:OprD family outer membrane porin n=1 Tax=Halopseudomonas formosensis TaxID=1002526 RepID=A0A1I6C1P5_9GAMM|nr:OprD family outer membrane porin [Halopseudomonas formosensis]MDX9687919.1 OprD family outer membrane porin [Halopseudomonas formosensis]SFQ87079.1 outer membrane porin, OprD family [Halopseudomonas formosensis]
MTKYKLSAIALALMTSVPALAAGQADSKGFVEDSSLDLFLRNAYMNRDYKHGADDKVEWGQGAVLTFNSGFTQGVVGFGVDAFGQYAVRLDSGRGRAGAGGIDFFMIDNNGDVEKDVAHAGAAIKARFSNTVLSYGDQQPALPVLSHDNSRLLPEAYTGTMITSNEIDGLTVHAGRFHAQHRKSDEGRDSGGLKSIEVLGGSYQFSDNFRAALYASDVEDRLKRQYANLNYVLPMDQNDTLTLDFSGYRTKQDKDWDGSGDRNNLWSLSANYATGPHDFTVAYQRSSGDTGYNYGFYQNQGAVGDGGTTIWVANSFWSDFNAEDERSWQFGYGHDFTQYGIPGLSYNFAYIYGTDINDGTGRGSGSEREIFNQLKYVVQSGAAKDMSIRLRSSFLRVSNNASAYNDDGNEVRIFVDFPMNIL